MHPINSLLNQISQLLDTVENHINENNWDMVTDVMARVASLQSEIKNHSPSVKTLQEQNPAFQREYEPLKDSLLEKAGQVISIIEKWKVKQVGKISNSKNVLDNLSRYYKPSTTSYYFDRKE
jgi:regulator of replication initiation timing